MTFSSFFKKLFGKKNNTAAKASAPVYEEPKDEIPSFRKEDEEVIKEFDPEVICYAPVGPYTQSQASQGLTYKSKEYYDAYIVTGRGTCTDKAVIIPESVDGHVVVEIGKDAFKGDKELTKIIISEGVRYIEDSAFEDCVNLKELKLPTTIDIIGIDAFKGCKGLEEITIPKRTAYMKGGAFENCENVKKIRMPDTVDEIPYAAFEGCERIEEITIPYGAKKIGFSAFSQCHSLKTITIPETVETIEKYAFHDCATLGGKIVISEGVVTIGEHVFGDSGFEEISLPSTVKKIGNRCFSGNVKISFNGTIEEFDAIELEDGWNENLKSTYIKCTDGFRML